MAKGTRILRKTFFAQLFAYVISSLACCVGTLVDGIIIGQCLGTDSIAAFGIISPLMIAFSLGGAVVSSGARNRFARLMGGGELRQAQAVFSLSCVLAVGIGTAMMLPCLAFAAPISRFLGASGNAAHLLEKAQAYLVGIAVGLPAMNAMRILSAFMPIDNDRNLPIIASVVLTVTDVIFDLLAAFVLHGDTFEMGLATSLSYYAACAALLLHFRKKNILLRFSLRGLPWRETGGILYQGLPVGVGRLGNTVRSGFMNRLLAAVAFPAAIAAYSVQRQADSFVIAVIIGMADTAAMLAGILAGEENRPMLRKLLRTVTWANLTLTLGVAALVWLLAPQFSALYIRNNPTALRYSIRAVRCYALGMPLYGISISYFNYFQGIGRSGLSTLSSFLSECGFLVLLAWLLSFRCGADAVWYAFPATQLLMLVYYAVVVAVQSRRLKLGGTPLRERLLLLPRNFDAAEGDRLDVCCTTMEEVNSLSQRVWDFCDAHGCDPKRRCLMSLTVEEMAGNVIAHGFTKDKRRHSMEVRILKKGDEYIVRIRDDCVYFDPLKRLQLYSPEDPMHHVGLRMIIGLARETRYTCILKLNNLVVRV